ncbi:MAG: hypothetical protein EPO67_01330 [Reyranella sp.]|jgi:hypothetical protein|nr:MAG: hypothetical protein EPO67_01330 [Reyranella sp.]
MLLAAASAGCVYLALREVRRRYVSQWRLFAPASLALFVALAMALLQIAAQQPPWTLGAAFLAGALIGGSRGLIIPLKHDMYRPQMVVSKPAKLVLLGVALAVAAVATVEIIAAFNGPGLEAVRYWAALVANACAGAMLARAVVLTVRLHRHG